MIRVTWMGVATAPLAALLIFCDGQDRAFSASPEKNKPAKNSAPAATAETAKSQPEKLEHATFGAGCFWCSEAVFQQLKGITSVVSGYSGGRVKNPTYYQVSSGLTGHAEVVEITYDPAVISYTELLEVFWRTHDPTTLNQQEFDVGPQYRSVIYYHSEAQKKLAEEWKEKLDEQHAFERPIVTEITEFDEFYPAEDYHQDYFKQHRRLPYCAQVIKPKVDKVKKVFRDKLKSASSK